MEKENRDLAKSTSITTALHKVLECPVCMEVATSPVQQCISGHVTCSACVSKMAAKICPLCTQRFCVINSIFVNNLLEVLPRFCRYVEAGCKEVCVAGEDDEHDSYCGFRPITCRACGSRSQVQKMQKHYQDMHPSMPLVFKLKQDMQMEDFDPYSDITCNTPVFLDGNFIYMNTCNDTGERRLKVTCEVFYIGKPKHRYFVNVKYEKGNFVQHKTVRAITMKDDNDRNGLDTISRDVYNIEEFYLSIPQKLLSLLVLKNKSLKHSYTFFVIDLQFC